MFKKYICPSMSVPQMIKTEKYSWCNDYIAKVQETIESIRAIDLYLNTNHEEVIKNYENQLLSLEGDLSEAINGWNNLLNKEDVYHPSIRKKICYMDIINNVIKIGQHYNLLNVSMFENLYWIIFKSNQIVLII